MKIEIIGTGCPTCKKMYESVKDILAAKKLSAEVDYIQGGEAIERIMTLGVMGSPVLLIDNKIVLVGSADKNKLQAIILAPDEKAKCKAICDCKGE